MKIVVTSSDVLHSGAVPNSGSKMDASPGRSNTVITFITSPGDFVGQCSELCGPNHYEMPINVRAVSYNEFLSYYRCVSRQSMGGRKAQNF